MSASSPRDLCRATIATMPRSTRLTKTPEALTLDEAARAFKRIEAQLDAQRRILHAAVAAAVKSGMSKSEVGRRAGYTREYVSAIVEAAEKPTAPE